MKKLISKNIIPSGFSLALLILSGVSAISYQSMARLIDTFKWVQHTYEVQVTLEGLLSTIKDAETGRRGYIITSDKNLLKPYNAAIETINPRIQNLRELTADNPNQQRRLDILEPLIAEKVAGLKESIALSQSQRNSASLQIALTEEGTRIMDEIRQKIRQMQNEEQQLLKQRSAAAAASVRQAMLTGSIGTGLSFALLLLVYSLLHRENKKRRQAEEALRMANEKLEIRVGERTAELAATNQSLQAEIIERQRAEMAVRESEERFRSLIENALDIITVLDERGTVRYESPSVEKVLGYKPESLVNQDFFGYIHPDDVGTALKTFTHAIENSGVALSIEFRFQHQDGSWLILEAIGQKFLDLSGTINVVVNSRDITERKRAEETRMALEKEQELSELKLRFFSMTSHEFRTPISTILISAQILESCQDEWMDEKKLRNILRIQSAAKSLTQLLADIMTITRAEAGKLEFNPAPLNLENFCANLVEEMQLADNNQHRLVFVSHGRETLDAGDVSLPRTLAPSTVQDKSRLEGGKGFGMPRMDEKLLHSILTNLLSNAIKYSPAGSTVWFKLSYQLPERKSNLGQNQEAAGDNFQPSEVAVFRIQDEGIGILLKDQQRLFELFHRGENVGKVSGAGLGLGVAKKCVELHGGSITMSSEAGAGTTFTVTIPLNY
ncbi:CHASE3 domain-containing protein [Microcoleus sp. FACHB-68]|uniref:CHASE3 domain-containing protein n=1 Tax=Microcoleus sp. FACHB-68 TaxID=2692826 RepID=UPI0016897FA6|nr:CHASE3 domain-containing protein [Microcoleus sp. FACHB-68]MBD1939327.1 CHASE3 domain-containing protein [Microcoleus sp. FACHB-68]